MTRAALAASQSLTHVALGDPGMTPAFGRLQVWPRSDPDAASLYRARMRAARHVRTRYFSLLDGGGDVLLPGYWLAMEAAVDRMDADRHVFMVATRETINGQRGHIHPHHGVVIRTAAFNSIDWPAAGCFHFESMVYPKLAEHGAADLDVVVYDWRPGGASQWPTTVRARINSQLWLAGRPGVHFPGETA